MPLYEYRCTLCGAISELRLPVILRGVAGYCDDCATDQNRGTPLSTAKLARVITAPAIRGGTVSRP